MNYDYILKNLRLISNEQKPEQDITEFLQKHNCSYLLGKLGYTDKKLEALNRFCVNERYRTCKCIFEQLEANDIPYAVIKGATLSLAAYGDAYLRQSGDIDILIDRNDIDIVAKIMSENDFIQGRINGNIIEPFTRTEKIFHLSTTHQTAPYVKSTQNKLCPFVMVDINTDIFWGESKIKSDLRDFLSHTSNNDICGIKFSALKAEAAFVAMCLHHYKDFNSIYLLYERGLNFNHFCDIYYFVKHSDPNKDILIKLCENLKIKPFIYYCLYYTNLIFDDLLLDKYMSALYTPEADVIIDTYGLELNERRKWNMDFFSRLFSLDFHDYFESILSPKDLSKIHLNQTMM